MSATLPSKAVSRWQSLVKSSKFQIYVSSTRDPYVNLGIEHHLLTSIPKDSTALFLYVNKPCIVIGRNQNPWQEVNLGFARRQTLSGGFEDDGIPVLRRRSGGGTVFHDEENLNYSVISPAPSFKKIHHSAMLTRAIRQFNQRARVNQRFDVVLDQGPIIGAWGRPDASDVQQSSYLDSGEALKVSGTAYKITAQRVLHHGTCLIQSPNVGRISQYLASPARPFLKAKSVESVRSKVGNIFEAGQTQIEKPMISMQDAIIKEFCDMYDIEEINFAQEMPRLASTASVTDVHEAGTVAVGLLAEDVLKEKRVSTFTNELRLPNWLWEQTPRFAILSHPEEASTHTTLPPYFPKDASVNMSLQQACFSDGTISLPSDLGHSRDVSASGELLRNLLVGLKIHEIADFTDVDDLHQSSLAFQDASAKESLRKTNRSAIKAKPRLNDEQLVQLKRDPDVLGVLKWLNEMLGKSSLP